jgi:hypothetical protein
MLCGISGSGGSDCVKSIYNITLCCVEKFAKFCSMPLCLLGIVFYPEEEKR